MPVFPHAFGFAPRLAAFYAAIFVLIGIQLPFFPLWLKAKGLDAQTIGLVLAVPMVVRIFAIPVAARVADRTGALRRVIVVSSCAAVAGYVLVAFSGGAVTIMAAMALTAAVFSPVMPLAETYALKGLGARRYGPVRLWGSAAFILGSFAGGFAADLIPAQYLIWLIAFAALLNALAAAALSPSPPPAQAAETPGLPRRLLTDPAFLSVLIAASLIQGSHAVYYGFSTLQWSRIGLGGTTIAALWSLGVLAEIILFAFTNRLPAFLNPLALLFIGGAGAFVRWAGMAFDPPAAVLPFLQVLHALSFGATHLGALGFVLRHAPSGASATAQGHLAIALGVVMAGMTGVSGVLYAVFGPLSYLAMALAAGAGCVGALVAHRLRRDAAD